MTALDFWGAAEVIGESFREHVHDLSTKEARERFFADTDKAKDVSLLSHCSHSGNLAVAFKGSEDLLDFLHAIDDQGRSTGLLKDWIEPVVDDDGHFLKYD